MVINARPPHPQVDWSTSVGVSPNRRVEITCPKCGHMRSAAAGSVAKGIREGTFSGRCAECRDLVGPRLGPYQPVDGVDYSEAQMLPASGGRDRVAHVKVTCPECGLVRWKIPSMIQVNLRRGVFSARCRKCQTPKNQKRNKTGRQVLRRQGYVIVRRDGVPSDLQHWFDVVSKGRNWVLEHHVIMASKIGRALHHYETVHHCNGKRADNRPDNLRLYKRGDHHPGYGDFYQEWQEALAENARLKALTE